MTQPFEDAIRNLALTDGAVRPLPTPQAVPAAWPPVATHLYAEGTAWLPAAEETLAGVYTQVMPLVRFADDEGD